VTTLDLVIVARVLKREITAAGDEPVPKGVTGGGRRVSNKHKDDCTISNCTFRFKNITVHKSQASMIGESDMLR
jgi:hypothetical protein